VIEKLRKEVTCSICLNYFEDLCLIFYKSNICFTCIRRERTKVIFLCPV
ncbi:hypothetical protein DBR06_SOUSAS5510051, partial [Sousa chinensis]